MSPQGFATEPSGDGLHEGRRYALRTANGDVFVGVLLQLEPPLGLAGTVENLGGGLLRVNVFRFQGRADVHLWLSSYTLRAAAVEALRSGWQRLLSDLFPDAEIC